MEQEANEPDPAALAERLLELREEKKYVEEQIERVSGALADALGEGTKTRLGDVEVRVAKARPGMRVVEEGAVPMEFLTPKPDRKRLMAHVQETGEVPPGIELTEGRPTVFTKSVARDSTVE